MKLDLRLGDCIEVMRTLPDNSVDSVITDPPYHLTSNKGGSKGFMGKEWDGGDIAFRTEVWSECLRVLKPGGHLLSFGGSRTYHRMAVAIEDAGFEIRDQIMYIYGSGFPKSHNIGKAIDKIQGNERQELEPTGRYKYGFDNSLKGDIYGQYGNDIKLTKGNSDWEGWGTALKPAHEPIVMARKPLSEKSIAENVLKWGTGGINIDDCRIGSEVRTTPIHSDDVKDDTTMFGLHKTIQHHREETTQGRFPANLIIECICDDSYTKPAPKSGHWSKTTTTGFGEFGNGSSTYEGVGEKESGNMVIHTNPECPCYMLDQQSGVSKSSKVKSPLLDITGGSYNNAKGNTDTITERGHNDKGGASRFFYSPKVSKKERDMNMNSDYKEQTSIGSTYSGNQTTSKLGGNPDKPTEPKKNNHPTVKPIALMKYLIKLVSPPNAVILEPFLGSGSTGIAAKELGFVSTFIGIEKEQEYMDIAKQRIGE